MSCRPSVRLAILLWLIGTASLAAQFRMSPAGTPADPPPQEDTPPPDPAPPEFTIRGGEQVRWDQPADGAETPADLTFQLYVDGIMSTLPETHCEGQPGADVFDCQAPVPALTAGVHSLSISAVGGGEGRYEGPRSAAITVTVGAPESSQSTALAPSLPAGKTVTPVASGLDDATDLAVLPDGQILVTERSGRIRLFRNGQSGPLPALILADVTTGDGRGLLAVAADREFAATQFVFVLYTTGDGLRLARFRLAGDQLVDRAILMEGLPVAPAQPAAVLRMAPDRTLYLALDDGGSPQRSGDLGDLAGKVLRVNPDGTTPRDQPAGSPIRLSGLHRPSALAWGGESRSPWVADTAISGRAVLYQVPEGMEPSTSSAVRLVLPARTGATALAGESRAAAARDAGVLAMNDGGRHELLRIARANSGEMIVTAIAPALDDPDRVRALAVGGDGAVYICTSQALLRLDLARH